MGRRSVHTSLPVALLVLTVLATLLCSAAFAQSKYDDSWTGTTLDPKWKYVDMGDAADLPGSAKVANGVLTLRGGGTDIWGTNDNMAYLYQSISGNFVATLKVLTVPQSAGGWTKGGLDLRQDTSPGSPHAIMAATGKHGVQMQWRQNQDGDSYWPGGSEATYKPPVWVRIVRWKGTSTDTILGYKSFDGTHWELAGAVEIALTDPVLIGIEQSAVTGVPPKELSTCQFGPFTVAVSDPNQGMIAATVLDRNPDAQGNDVPIANAWVSAMSGGQIIGGGPTDANGKAYIIGLPSGAIDLKASKVGYAQSTSSINLTAGARADATLRIAQNPSLSLSSDDIAASGISAEGWKLRVLQPGEGANDFSPADPAYNDSSWQSSVPVPDASVWDNQVSADNVYGWYRLKFKFPKAFADQARGNDLLLTNFNVDDQDMTYFNGHFVGSNTVWDASRYYSVPGAYVNYDGDNVIAIRGFDIGGAGGMTQRAPILVIAGPMGAISGKVTDVSGAPAANVSIRFVADATDYGGQDQTITTLADGTYFLGALPAGQYRATIQDRVDLDDLTGPTTVNVQTGQTTTLNLSVRVRPSFWLTKENGVQWLLKAGTDVAPTDDYSAVNASESGFVRWDVTMTNGAWDAIVPDDNVFGWARAHVRLPADWKATYGSSDMILEYNFDDTDDAYVNGTKVGSTGVSPTDLSDPTGSGYFSQYFIVRDYTVPNSLIKWDGDNVIAIRGYDGGGAGGFTTNIPRIIPAASPVPPPVTAVKGDANGDGKVLVNDAVLALQFAVGLKTPSADQLKACDLNGDGKVGINEATLILQAAVGLRTL